VEHGGYTVVFARNPDVVCHPPSVGRALAGCQMPRAQRDLVERAFGVQQQFLRFVILSRASAPLLFPPRPLRRADAQSKDPYTMCRRLKPALTIRVAFPGLRCAASWANGETIPAGFGRLRFCNRRAGTADPRHSPSSEQAILFIRAAIAECVWRQSCHMHARTKEVCFALRSYHSSVFH
jgi:hypothetical protein